MAIDTTSTPYDLKLRLPVKVKSGTHLLSTGNETANLCQESPITIDEPVKEIVVSMPERSLNTYIFMIDHEEETAVNSPKMGSSPSSNSKYFDLKGRSIPEPRGLCIEQSADGSTRKVWFGVRR